MTLSKSDLRSQFPTLESDRLVLRQITLEDTVELYPILMDPQVKRFISFSRSTLLFPERMQRYFEDCRSTLTSLHFIVTLKSGGDVIGLCSFQRWNERKAQAVIGYLIAPQYWDQKYATEAAKTLLDFGFLELKLKVVHATCHTNNVASHKVLLHCGFQLAEHGRIPFLAPGSPRSTEHQYVRIASSEQQSSDGVFCHTNEMLL